MADRDGRRGDLGGAVFAGGLDGQRSCAHGSRDGQPTEITEPSATKAEVGAACKNGAKASP